MADLEALFTKLRPTIWFAIGMIQDHDATEAEREEALDRLARYLELAWHAKDLRVKRKIARTLRFHPEGWVVDEAGHKLAKAPGELTLAFADRWAYSRARKVAEALLLDMTPDVYEQFKVQLALYGESTSLQPVRDDDVAIDHDADPAYLLSAREEALEEDAEDAAFCEIMIPAQRRLCLARLAQGEKVRVRAKLRPQGYAG